MEWNAFEPLPKYDRPVDQKAADLLTRRINDLVKLREKVDKGEAWGRFYGPRDAVNEAMRRELILRQDIGRFLQAMEDRKPRGEGEGPAKLPADPKLAEVFTWLDDNGGHRTRAQ